MKTLKTLVMIILSFSSIAQEIFEKELKSDIKEVTVYLEGAQITREKQIELSKGTTDLKFTGLSPFIDAKTIQVKSGENLTVLSVNYQLNYINKTKTSDKVKSLNENIKSLNELIVIEQTNLKIIDEQLSFLQENKVIGGKNDQLTIDNLKATSEFYGSQVSALLLNKVERNKKIELLNKQINDLNDEIKTISAPEILPSGEILVRVSTDKATSGNIKISYFVINAGWLPTYDIRAKTVNEPIEITYRANIHQDTKEDWENVVLTLTTSNPANTNTAPAFVTYYLHYYSIPPSHITSIIHEVSGIVTDETYAPLIGAMVTIPGTTIGTITDIDGKYSLSLPANAKEIKVDYIGFYSQTVQIKNSNINFNLKLNNIVLEDVVVVACGNSGTLENSGSLAGAIRGVKASNLNEDKLIPFEKVENQTSFNYQIKTPYSIKSDKKSFFLDIVKYNIPATYQYFTFPKVDENAYLNAFITDWEKYNFLEGEANIFFENNYIGKTILDVRYMIDTLKVSLGQDKSVSVSREPIKNFSKRQLLGNKKSETKASKLIIKNNKNQPLNIMVIDQLPVPSMDDISLTTEELSGGNYDKNSGKIEWTFDLKSLEKKEFELRYSVKYPKYRSLKIE